LVSVGQQNLLSELKVAWAWSEQHGRVFTSRELVATATIGRARMIGWDAALGSIRAGKQADMLVIAGRAGNPYERLLKARDVDVELVLIRGVPRFGAARVMKQMRALIEGAPDFESRKMDGELCVIGVSNTAISECPEYCLARCLGFCMIGLVHVLGGPQSWNATRPVRVETSRPGPRMIDRDAARERPGHLPNQPVTRLECEPTAHGARYA
jgi:hypothetical protein